MLPHIEQGDILIFEREQYPKVGRIVLALNGDNEATVKQLAFGASGYSLVALNGGEEMHASRWSVFAVLIARIREHSPGHYSQTVNEGGLLARDLI